MKMLIVPTSASGTAAIEAAEDGANTTWHAQSSSATAASSGATLDLTGSTLVSLNFDQASHLSIYYLNVTSAPAGDYAFFCEHFPTEFEGSAGHYLKDAADASIEPTGQNRPGGQLPAHSLELRPVTFPSFPAAHSTGESEIPSQ